MTKKGYVVQSGYMGYVEDEGRYMLFSSESDYEEYLVDLEIAQSMTPEELLAEIEKRHCT